MAENFSCILWQKLFEDFETRFGLPREAAFPYLERLTANLKSQGASALTGPLQRKDQSTIEANMKALEGDDFQKIYKTFVEITQWHPKN